MLFLLHGIDEVEADVSELDILASDDKLDGSCFINPSDMCSFILLFVHAGGYVWVIETSLVLYESSTELRRGIMLPAVNKVAAPDRLGGCYIYSETYMLDALHGLPLGFSKGCETLRQNEYPCFHNNKQMVSVFSVIDAMTFIDRAIVDQVEVAGSSWPIQWGTGEATSKNAYYNSWCGKSRGL